MATVNVYLTFNGNTEEAFNFYKSVFGGDFTYLGRFKDMPADENCPPPSEDEGNRIMHVSLPISKETILMGSDSTSFSGDVTFGNNFSVSINTNSKEEADKLANVHFGGRLGQYKYYDMDRVIESALGFINDCKKRRGLLWKVLF